MSSAYRDRPDGPVDDAERERLSQRLRAAYEAGALDDDEFNGRLDRLWAAKRLGELVPVVEGLPPVVTHDQPAIVQQTPAGRPGELAPIRRAPAPLVLLGGGVLAVVVLLILVLLIVF